MVGQRIRKVLYREIDYEDGQDTWHFDNFDSPDYGVELFLMSGSVVSMIWASRYFLGLEFIEDTLDQQLKGYEAVWDVSAKNRWRGLLETKITEALVYWGEGELADTFEVPAPIGFSLRFEGGSHVHLTYGEYYDDRPEIRGGEGITLFFDDDVLRRYGIDPEQPTKYETTVRKPADLDEIPDRPNVFLRSYRLTKIDR